MRLNYFKTSLKTALLVTIVFLLGAKLTVAQVNLTAEATSITLPDGSVVPMWGYSCGAAGTAGTGTCAALNPLAPPAAGGLPAGWSPVVITVATGQSLTINLTNNLTFLNGNSVPTSLVIVGQLGGGLGTTATSTASPDHSNLPSNSVSWPIAGGPGFLPPSQQRRVQSFSTEVAAGATTALTWTTLRPGTYLIESGTHPSIQGPMGLYGILVVTTAPVSATAAGTAYPAVGTSPAITYNAEIPLLMSEIDPLQNNAVNAAVNTLGFTETAVWSGQPNGCGNPASSTFNTCYPPAVNYTPLYYLFNGVAFDKTQTAPSPSLFATAPATGLTAGTGTILVRLVNAGSRMHVPSIVGSQTGTAVAPATTPPSGFSLIAEDGNPLPGTPRVQSEVFMAAGKTYDVMVNVPAGTTALPVFDRELSLSGNATARDAGMLAYISANSAGLPASPALAAAVANPDTYNSVITGQTLIVSDPAKGVIANDKNVYGVQVSGAAPAGLTLNANGTFTYTGAPTTFSYCGNGATTGNACTTVALNAAPIEAAAGITCGTTAYTSNVASSLSIKSPGVLSVCKDALGYPLTVGSVVNNGGLASLSVDPTGGFNATAAAAGTYTFTYTAKNSQGTISSGTGSATLTFPTATGLVVNVIDGGTKAAITDYRWIIEEDRTFYVNPACTTNPPPAGCPSSTSGIVPTFGTNFHTSYMPLVAAGCMGTLACEDGQTVLGLPAVCDVGNGVCRTTASQQTAVDPSQVYLDPTKHYYISVLPGDAANPFEALGTGHGMGGAPIACIPLAPAVTCTSSGTFPAITVLAQQTPFPPSKLSVFVFQDDFPLNGEQDGGGGIDVLSPNEPGLGQFNITLFDDAGGTGDATGQMTYDMFNQPLSNSLSGTIDPVTSSDACPISATARIGVDSSNSNLYGAISPTGITGTIVTCPKYEADGITLSPLAGQAVIANLMPGRYGVVATPGADRIARGEEWLQTNTLDGQKAHDSFLRIGEPSFFQEFGPAGYHVSIGFANPKIINDRRAAVCAGSDPFITGNCTPGNTVTGTVTTVRMSRTPDERLYSSGDNSSFAFSQCFVSFGDPDGEDFAFTKCDANGQFTLTGLPDGDWRITVFDQWNDMLVDGLSTPVRLGNATGPFCPGTGSGRRTCNMGDIAMNQWQANIYTSTFFDLHGTGVRTPDDPGLTLVPTNIRFRDGSYSNFNNTDLSGNAGFNEIFPLFSWYVIETDSIRYKSTGTHVVYDAGGPADGSPSCGQPGSPACKNSTIAGNLARTAEDISVPANLRVPGAVYCANADCTGSSIATGPVVGGSSGPTTNLSTGRIDPPWVLSEGWQGFSGQNSFIEFGKTPFKPGETGGIHGEVIYASTRPFDDPQLLLHTSWTPDVPGVTINLYKESTAPDGSLALTLVDTTKTSSFDDWAQGFRSDGNPNMNCPGQGRNTGTDADLFFFSLFNQPNYLDAYNNGGTPLHTLPANSQFKCYDGMHNWNQVQPAPYDGMYQFPSVAGISPTTGKPTGGAGSVAGSNCTICIPNPDSTDPYRYGTPMLPAGKYVVEMLVPPGYELVKEEDKNILIGDNYIAPVTQQFGGLGGIFIVPDQAEVASAYNANNPQNPTQTLGRVNNLPSHEGDTGSVETFWPCVGASRIVPDYISLFPHSAEVAPFAGATRNLCDRKEVTLDDQTSALAKFWVFTSAHVAAHFTGVITDDFTSEFDPFSPQFGEKFSPPNLPISIKDWTGTEIARTYTDHWGSYNGLTYSTWEVNPPNPTGYAPTMMVTCMNDPGTGLTPDPLFNPQYSQFCYEIPFMPGQTQYMDTPVVPTSAFAGAGYNNPDCAYPALTPAISEVDGDQIGPWVSAAGHTLTITALGDQTVYNNAYSGPSANVAPFNQKKSVRHYGFGSSAGVVALVGSDGVAHPLTGVSWSDTLITGAVPSGLPNCTIQQQQQYGAPTQPAQCGELVISTANTATSGQPSNARQSIDTVTVTIGGKGPTHVGASASIQSAIDLAQPGDLLIIDPTCTAATGPVTCTAPSSTAVPHSQSSHVELLLMWKPVRLQGVGAASSIINANTHPAGKMDGWRARVQCLFGMAANGTPNHGDLTCGTGWTAFSPTDINPQIDRLPTEATVGWDTTLNGNLAEMLQEPSLMGALEGAAITVLSKGVNFPSDPFAPVGGTFPTGTLLLTNSTNAGDPNGCGPNTTTGHNPFPSNFWCNPSSIDGLGITNSSQGGGGIYVHAWGHNLQIANNRVYNNSGTLTGGISVGQGEFPPAYLVGGIIPDPGSCQFSNATNVQLPYCHDLNVNVHHNAITANSSTGDELFSATPAGAGGVSFCSGADNYKFNYNWVCGNLSTGDGGGVGQFGFVYNGDIEHNSILFNQSTNPTIAANGGGLLIMGAPDVDPPCSTSDQDCVGATNLIGPSDGTGPGLVINANLIMGNAADSGSGGGLRLQNINGGDVVNFPTTPSRWYSVNVTNNIIANNVAGWDGAGISLVDALAVNIINNTIMSNDTTASSGVLFNTIGAPLASSQGPCVTNPGTGLPPSSCVETSTPQPAGLVSIQNSAILTANLPATITCPAGHFVGPNTAANNGTCRSFSYPLLANDVFYQNRSFNITVGALGPGTTNQQHVVTLVPTLNQTATGACVSGANYWDIGVRGDTGPGNHSSGVTLNPTYSFLTSTAGYGSTNSASNPAVTSQYCNGSRIPPECTVANGCVGSAGYQVPPGISDATVPNPIFNLTPAATVDEGNNWINISWGPLAETNPVTGATFGNYGPATAASPVVNYIPTTATVNFNEAPATDIFGNLRKTNNAVDAGAVEFPTPPQVANGSVTGGPLSFGNVAVGMTSAPQTLTLHNTGNATLTGITLAFSSPRYSRPAGAAGGTCPATLGAALTCTINVVFSPTVTGAVPATLTISASVPVTGSPVTLSGTGVAPVVSATLTPASFSPTETRTCPGTTAAQISACANGPAQNFTLTNTGNVTLTGIGQGVLAGTNTADYLKVGGAGGSSCGPTGSGQTLSFTSLAPGAMCIVRVQFRPQTSEAAGVKNATVSVTDSAGTQTSTLAGTAN